MFVELRNSWLNRLYHFVFHRSYMKILEVQKHMGIYMSPNDLCIDLGSSPGFI